MANDPVVAELKKVWLAIQSLNPDPQATIQSYRDQRAAQQRAAEQLVTATSGLVDATSRLVKVTWVLVALTAVLAIAAVVALMKKAGA
jgi:hypothetical protein